MPNDNVLPRDLRETLEEAREILTNLKASVEKHGPYSAEATSNFLEQALQCLQIAAQPKPPHLPNPMAQFPTEEDMRRAREAHAGQPDADGWLQSGGLLYRLTDERIPQNRDEINVTMADGSRDDAACARRAEQLLAFLAGQPEPHAEASPGVIAAALAVIEADRSQTLTNEHVDALDIAIKIQRGVFKLPEARAEVTDATRERRHWNPVYNTDPVQRACVELPDGYEIEIMLERDAGTVDVCGPDGGRLDVDLDEDTFDWKIHAAIDAAIGAARAGGQHADQA